MTNLIDNILKEIDKGNYKEAIIFCNELLIQHPGNPAVYELRGICNYNLSLLENARDDFYKVIELNPEAPKSFTDSLRKKIENINSLINESSANKIPDFDFESFFKDMPLIEDEGTEKKTEVKESEVKDFNEEVPDRTDLISRDLLKLHSEIEGMETKSKDPIVIPEDFIPAATEDILPSKAPAYEKEVMDSGGEIPIGKDFITPDLLKLHNEIEGIEKESKEPIVIPEDFIPAADKEVLPSENFFGSSVYEKEALDSGGEIPTGKDSISPDLLKLHSEFVYDNFDVKAGFPYDDDRNDFFQKITEPEIKEKSDYVKSDTELIPRTIPAGGQSEIPAPEKSSAEEILRKPIPVREAFEKPAPEKSSAEEVLRKPIPVMEPVEKPAPEKSSAEEVLRKPIPADTSEFRKTQNSLLTAKNQFESSYRRTKKPGLFNSPLFIILASFAGVFLILLIVYILLKTGGDKTNAVISAKDTTEAVKDTSTQEVQEEISQESITETNEEGTEAETTEEQTTEEQTTEEETTKKESAEKSSAEQVKKEESENETVKEENIQETPVTESPATPKTIGFISDKRKFMMFRETDGFWVQVGSFKDKTNAQNMLGILEKNGLKARITEADLGTIGVFFRVRAGSFSSQEDAKGNTIRLE